MRAHARSAVASKPEIWSATTSVRRPFGFSNGAMQPDPGKRREPLSPITSPATAGMRGNNLLLDQGHTVVLSRSRKRCRTFRCRSLRRSAGGYAPVGALCAALRGTPAARPPTEEQQ
jgi:hypothetical protein